MKQFVHPPAWLTQMESKLSGLLAVTIVSGLIFLDPSAELCVNGPLCDLAARTSNAAGPHVHGDFFSGLASIYGVSYVLISTTFTVYFSILMVRLGMAMSGVNYCAGRARFFASIRCKHRHRRSRNSNNFQYHTIAPLHHCTVT